MILFTTIYSCTFIHLGDGKPDADLLNNHEDLGRKMDPDVGGGGAHCRREAPTLQ